ncbi:tetratricopeptide repeat protein 16-like isoform X1 [Sinocyclocheilus rhinocerous]|uniref:tetratricopeptide repeat protein 16-like isoform X1 n=1 Tax=Sinocyclocheilus rhinocerous TaxID=307959 RepID=UPI0007BACEF9|nr:PREDICTED: tetratricopeptide repeat protein 16-like isoform X1 [Sinocyclocheilus rhinocerous]
MQLKNVHVFSEKKKPDMYGERIIKEKTEKHYEAGVGAMSQSHFDKAVSCFSKAILLQPHQTKFYVQRAEAYLQLCDFQSAALDYKHACSLDPQTEAYPQQLAFIYYLQGQCCFDLGKFLEALESFTKAAELKPSFRPYHTRSLACLTALGRYSDCLRLVNNWLETDGQSADLFTLRARLHHQLNQMTLCYHDLRSALRLKPCCPEAQALLKRLKEAADDSHQAAVDKALKGELSDALGKINTALEYNPNKAQYYLFRGILYRRLKDFTAAIEDLILAVEFCGVGEDPSQGGMQDISEDLEEDAQIQLILTYNDFAIQCFSRNLYGEAIMLLNKAIEKQRDANELFINRGDCFFKQCEWTFALADYQQAEEMDPDNTDIWLRLAVIHNTLGLHSYEDKNYQEAAGKFSVAIRYNPGEVHYYENRAKAYSKVAKMEEAKMDAIRVLILEPTNDQVLPLLSSLLPGCSLTDIMSCATAQSVTTQLTAKIQAFKLAVSKVSRIGRMALAKEESQSQTSSQKLQAEDGSEEMMKPCVTPREVQCKLVKRKQQLNQAVKRALQQRQPLHYDGPRLALHHPVREEPSTRERPYVWRKFGGFGLNC